MCKSILLIVCSLAVAANASNAFAQMIAPDSATASSEFNSNYVITNVINGSGLPGGFTLLSPHATYIEGNHWTTQPGALTSGNARASFFFSRPRALSSFNMWNHRSNNIANDPGYAVSQFDLIFRDSNGAVLSSLLNQTALPNVLIAQNYFFPTVAGVSRVDFVIDANSGSPFYTGLAEVRFNGVPAPTACSIADLVGGDGNPPADSSVDGNDFQAFLNAFGSGDALADIVGGDGNPPADGSVDGNDFQAFLNAFAAGC